MRKFDTQVQELKYRVLKEVARHEFSGDPPSSFLEIPSKIIPGPNPTTRCCIHKERAIVAERVRFAMDADKVPEHIVEVIELACDECPMGGYEIGADCRGCIAHRCEDVCPKDAIDFINQKAVIDKNRCVNCGACAKVCPYNAVLNRKRPCEVACKAKAISQGENLAVKIDYDKCTDCGTCVYHCPFGALMDHSFIAKAIKILKGGQDRKVYAVVAPSISSQFRYATLGQVVTGLKELGFHTVVEAALGADMVALKESAELAQKGFLTSSCCPAFVKYVKQSFPDMAQHVSHNLSPMAEISRVIKRTDPDCKVIFIGPCTAKKAEAQLDSVLPYVDCVLTFEELQAMFDAKGVDITSLEEGCLDNASYFGRIFARSGGLSDAVAKAMQEQGIDEHFTLSAEVCDGLENCRTALMKAARGIGQTNFIEGMACTQGCIGGAGCLTHGPKDKKEVDKYGAEAMEKTITDAVAVVRKVYPGAV